MRSIPAARLQRQSLCESLESRLMFARVEGVDVSLFQGAINWNTMYANNKEFAFIRSSRTNLDLDSQFHTNVAGATAAGLIVGPYQRVLPKGESEGGVYTDPITDARRFVNAAGSIMDTGYIRPVIDAEDGYTLGKAALSKWVNDFSDEVFRLKGVRPIIYCNGNYATNYLDESVAAKHDLWIARWNGNNANNVNPQTDQPETPAGYANSFGSWNVPVGGPPSNDSWDFWQYTSNGDGVAHGASSARLDLDVFNGDLNTLKERFMIGYQKNFSGANLVTAGGTTLIQAENYDIGGQGVSYNDTTPASNTGGVYRTSVREGVELKLINGTTNQYRLGDAFPGEWVEYTIDVAQAGNYRLDLSVSQTDPNAKIHVDLDGATNLTGVLTVPDTNNFSTFATIGKNVVLPAGRHVLRVAFDVKSASGTVAGVDWLKISPATVTPPSPGATVIKSTVASYVRGGTYASQNYGSSIELNVKKASSAGSTRDGYIKFDLTGVTTINTAKLRVYGRLTDTTNTSLRTNIYSAANTSWSESGLTWNNKPVSGTTLRGSVTVAGTTSKFYEVDLTSFLKAELAAGRKIVTIVLKGTANSNAYTIFGSDESANGPALNLT